MLLCIYTAGILLAVIMARIFSKFLVKGEDSPFVMELPPYRMPTSKSIMRHNMGKRSTISEKDGRHYHDCLNYYLVSRVLSTA